MTPIRPPAFATPPAAPRWQRWLLYSPAARIAIYCVFYFLCGTAASALVTGLGVDFHRLSAPQGHRLVVLFDGVIPLLAYLLLVTIVERRRPAELAADRLPSGAGGLLLGALLFGAVVGCLWLLGDYRLLGTAVVDDVPGTTAQWLLGSALGEEVIARGVLFRIVEEGLGTWPALAATALYFAAMHLHNQGMSAVAAGALAVYGIGFGLIFHLTRSLYACIGVHGAWNFTESAVFGLANSGASSQSWLRSGLDGPTWLSGGGFGPEASLISIALWLVLAACLLVAARRLGSIVPPPWRHRTGIPAAA